MGNEMKIKPTLAGLRNFARIECATHVGVVIFVHSFSQVASACVDKERGYRVIINYEL
jgi:hypothetical protein